DDVVDRADAAEEERAGVVHLDRAALHRGVLAQRGVAQVDDAGVVLQVERAAQAAAVVAVVVGERAAGGRQRAVPDVDRRAGAVRWHAAAAQGEIVQRKVAATVDGQVAEGARGSAAFDQRALAGLRDRAAGE